MMVPETIIELWVVILKPPGDHLELQVTIVELYEAIVSSRRSF